MCGVINIMIENYPNKFNFDNSLFHPVPKQKIIML